MKNRLKMSCSNIFWAVFLYQYIDTYRYAILYRFYFNAGYVHYFATELDICTIHANIVTNIAFFGELKVQIPRCYVTNFWNSFLHFISVYVNVKSPVLILHASYTGFGLKMREKCYTNKWDTLYMSKKILVSGVCMYKYFMYKHFSSHSNNKLTLPPYWQILHK